MPATRKRKALYPDADLGFRSKKVKSLKDHFKEYVLEEGTIKKVTAPKLGETHTTTGSLKPVSSIIHLKNDAFPEPVDNIHSFRIKFPCPAVVNFVPEHDDDFLLFPRIKSCDIRVYHKTIAMGIPGNSTRVGEIRPKNVGAWISTDTLSEKMKMNPDFIVSDEEDLLIKYDPNGFRMFRNTCQKVSLMDDQDVQALGVTTNTLSDARTNLEKVGGVFNVRPTNRTGYAGVHVFDVSQDFAPEPVFITDEVWNKETGQLHSDSCYLHLWLEEGVLDENTTIWYTITWSLEKITAKEMWYYQNKVEQRQKLIESGSYINEKLKDYREKQQLVYSVKGIDNDMCYLWKTYLTNGNIVPYLSPGIISRDVSELEPTDIPHKTYDATKPYYVGDIKLPDNTMAEFAGPALSDATVTAIEAKKGIALDKDAFVRKGVLMETRDKLTAYDQMDAPSPSCPPSSPNTEIISDSDCVDGVEGDDEKSMDEIDADFLRDTQNILNTILQTDAINTAIQAGQALKDVLSAFSAVNISPGIQQLVTYLIPKIEKGLQLSRLAERVRRILIGDEDERLTNFTKLGVDLRTDGKKQTIYWQLEYLFRTKQDKADAVTMSQVGEEIAKRLLNLNLGSGSGGGSVDQAALQTLQDALSKLEEAFKASEAEQASINSSATTTRSDLTTIEQKMTTVMTDLSNFKNRFSGILATVNSIGPRLPGSDTLWEEIHKIFVYLGKTNLDNFNSTSDKTITQKVTDLDSLVKAIPAEDLKNQILTVKARITAIASRVLNLENRGGTGGTGGADVAETKKLDEAFKIAHNLLQVVGGLEDDTYDVIPKAINDPTGNLVRNARFFLQKYTQVSTKMVIVYNLLGIPDDQTSNMITDTTQTVLARLRKIDEEIAAIKTADTGGAGGSSSGGVSSSQLDAIKQLYNNVTTDLNSLTVQISKLNGVIGSNFISNFDRQRDQNLSTIITDLQRYYSDVVTSMKTIEASIPDKKVLDVVGKDYVKNFVVGTSASIADRLDAVEALGTTSGAVPGRNYWFSEQLRTPFLTKVSEMSSSESQHSSIGSWSQAHKDLINTSYLYIPLNATKHKEDLLGVSVWDSGTLRLFRGKCYIIIMLTFYNRAAQSADLRYQLAITNADITNQTETVIAKADGFLDNNTELTVGATLYKVHSFHFRNTDTIPAAMIRFNWFNSYPAYNTMTLDANALYFAPIYYSASGKAYMNPNPSALQEVEHPYYPDHNLAYFGVISNERLNVRYFIRVMLHNPKFNVTLMENRDGIKPSPQNELATDTNNGWSNDQIVKIPNQYLYSQRMQGCILHSWWGKETSTQGLFAKPDQPADERIIRIFNHGANIGEGLFLLTCELPEFMIFGLETHSYSVELNMLSLFGIDQLCVEVVGVLHGNDSKGLVASDIVFQFEKDESTKAITPFESGEHDLQSGLIANLKLNPSIQTRQILKKYITIPQIAPDDISYQDPVTRNHITQATKDNIMLTHAGLKNTTSFDLGTLSIDNDITQLFINIYPKFYGTNYDFAARANFGFKFGDGIMGEGVFGVGGPGRYYGEKKYKI